jgi:hypothetical protein
MAQFFQPRANTLTRGFIALAALLVVGGFWILTAVSGSAYVTRQGEPREQPVPFSHEHHVGGLGLDCRYCHTSVENSSTAGIPPTRTCMNCHASLWTVAPELAPVRESWRTGKSIEWTRVHDLPGYVYFHHGIHVQKGISCAVCHGRVDKMPLMWQNAPLTMEWCLECHRNPEKYVRPKDQVFNMAWQAPPNQIELGRKLVREYHIESLTSCSTCHR